MHYCDGYLYGKFFPSFRIHVLPLYNPKWRDRSNSPSSIWLSLGPRIQASKTNVWQHWRQLEIPVHSFPYQCEDVIIKTLVFKSVSNFNILALRALYCGNTFCEKLKSWHAEHEFKQGTLIESDDGMSFTIPVWYAQPSAYPSGHVQMIIDPHHLYVNNQARV